MKNEKRQLQFKSLFRNWTIKDYIESIISVGGVFFLAVLTTIFAGVSIIKHIAIPPQAYAIPFGFWAFFSGWWYDNLLHRTLFRDRITEAELLIHNLMTYGSGYIFLFLSILSFWFKSFLMPFVFVFLMLKTMYSIFDESMHWKRYENNDSNNLEMFAHYLQFLGVSLYSFAFVYWIYFTNYSNAGRVINETYLLFLHLF
jgi:hypothetical protein